MTSRGARSEGQTVGLLQQEKMTHPEFAPTACGVFPLPRPPSLMMCRGLGRGASQRLSRKVRIRSELRETISALNWMHTGDFDSRPGGPSSTLQYEVLDRLERMTELAGDLGDQRHLPSQEAALRELLHGQDGYAEPSVPASLAPFKLELISLPQDLRGAPRAEDLLPLEDRRYLEVQERMLRSDLGSVDEQPSKPYWDPALRHNPRNYRKFIQKLHSIEYLEYTLSPSQHAGVFFVWKSDKQKIRMIVDARPANSEFVDPPGVSLSTAETFAKFEVDSVSAELGDDFGLYVGLSDVKDCFHRIKQPRWLSKHFCFLPIEARHVGMTGCWLEGRQLGSNDLIYPMPGSLCMGFTWSLFFAQRINEVMMDRVSALKGSSLVHDRGGPAVFSSSSPQDMKHFVYVDNLGVLSPSRQAVEDGLAELSQKFTAEKLLLHPGEVLHERIKALGVELDGKSLTSKISPDRFHRVRQGLRCILHRGRCSGRVLEILVGHCTYCGLMNRSLLSVFHNCYKFIRSTYYVSTKLWASVASELRAFCGLMPFLRADWCRPWNGTVAVSDASEEGFGVCASSLHSEVVASIGRVSERDRFRRCSGHSAREAALTSAGFVKDEVTGKWAEGILEDEDYLRLSGWDLEPSFPEIPKQHLHEEDWTVVRQGRWRRREHIVHLEARALVKSFEFIVHDQHASNTRQLFLVDSMSAALAFDRCRSKNHRMLRQIRKFCSLGLARNISFSVRWVPSEFNPADAPSRDQSQVITSAHQWCRHGTKTDHGACSHIGHQWPKETLSGVVPRDASEHKGEEKVKDIGTIRCARTSAEGTRFQVSHFGSVESPDFSSGTKQQEAGLSRQQQFGVQFRFTPQEYTGQATAAEEPKQAEEVRAGHHGSLEPWPFTLGAEGDWGAGWQVLQSGVPSFDHVRQGHRTVYEDPTEMDACLNRYFNHLFLQGHPAHRGDKILATVMHHLPQYGRQGTQRLPHSWRALKGWRRLAPGSSRKAFPLAVWAAISCELQRRGYLQMALFTMMGLSAYTRPGELLRCRVYSLVKPSPTITEFWTLLLNPEERPERSKVGEYDDSVALDSPYLKGWGPVLMKQLVDRDPELPLWNFDYSHYSKVFGQVVDCLGLDMTPYQLRHSGPSIDRSRNLRSLEEVQKRGRWKSHKSVARYEKSARLAANFQALLPSLQHHCLVAEQQLGAVMLNRAHAPIPPSKPKV